MEEKIIALTSETFGVVHAVELEGETWFSGKEAAEALGHANASRAISTNVPEEHLRHAKLPFLGQRGGWLVDRQGLKALALASKTPDALELAKEIARTALPPGADASLLEKEFSDGESLEKSKLAGVYRIPTVDCFKAEDGAVWFRLADVGEALDLSDSAVRKMKQEQWFDPDEVMTCKKKTHGVCTGNSATYISESALYRIFLRSTSPKAKPFERWVTQEVLPTIRKTGRYPAPTAEEQERLLEEAIAHPRKAAQALRDYADRLEALEGGSSKLKLR